MPADSLTIAVTTGLGFSVLAGIVSGVCYILTYGLPQTRRRRSLTLWQCSICGRHFRSIDGVLEVEKVATCAKCGVKACKEKCATREPSQGWLCNNCKPETWFASLLHMLQPSTSKGVKKMEQTRIDEIDEDLLALQKREREQVRDFIERLVGALLGGDLDDVSVKKVYNDVKYDAIFARYHDDISDALTDLGSSLHISIANLPISGQSPCSTHATLKLLIQKFIQEAAELPKLQKFEDHPAIPDDTRDRTYEDLLSTAIINKVIQNSQEGAPSRSVSSRASSRRRDEKEYFFGERNLDSRRIHDDTSSLSSLDSDTMSLKIHGCIKEVSSSGDETKDEDEVDTVPHNKSSIDWQDNWRLQKRKYNGTTSPVPVPMLVPDPITEAKVLIGDREAEDTTDLSDAASDYEEALEPSTLNSVLINSRTVIGGRSPLESLVSKQESISEDGSTDVTDLVQEKEDIVRMFNGEDVEGETIVEAVVNVKDEFIEVKDAEDESLISLDSNTEKDLEYTERYASLPRTIYKSPRLSVRQSEIDADTFDDLSISNEHKTDNVDSGVTSDEDEKQRIFKGTYSEREKEKWNHAVPLSNNPYSKSNLERRLSLRSSNSSINSSYDRDYYIREAAKSAGARKNATLSSPASTPRREEADDDEVLTAGAQEEKIQSFVFKAVPAVIQDEPESPKPIEDTPALPTSPKPIQLTEDEPESSIEPSTPTRPNQLDISSDSDLSIERTYNIETGQVIRKPNSFRNYVMEASRSPEGLKYLPKDFDIDENQNMLENKKRNFLRSLTCNDDEDTSSLLDSSFEAVTPPRVNHFKLVEDIANETSDQYDNTPLSPPAEYKTIQSKFQQQDENISSEDSEVVSAKNTTLQLQREENEDAKVSMDNDEDDVFKPVANTNVPVQNKAIVQPKLDQDEDSCKARKDSFKPVVNTKVPVENKTVLQPKLDQDEDSSKTRKDSFKPVANTRIPVENKAVLQLDKDEDLSKVRKPVVTPNVPVQNKAILQPKLDQDEDSSKARKDLLKPVVNTNVPVQNKAILQPKLDPDEDSSKVHKDSFKPVANTRVPVENKAVLQPALDKDEDSSNGRKNVFRPENKMLLPQLNEGKCGFTSAQNRAIQSQQDERKNSSKPQQDERKDSSKPQQDERKPATNTKNPAENKAVQPQDSKSRTPVVNANPVSELKSPAVISMSNGTNVQKSEDVKPSKAQDADAAFRKPANEDPSLLNRVPHMSLTDDDINYINQNMGAFKDKIQTVFNNNEHENEEFSLTYSEVSEPEAEITDLKEKKLVNNLLGEFSKSFPNLSKLPSTREKVVSPSPSSAASYRSASVDISEVEDDDDLPSVRRLSKIFDANKNGKQEQVYSLTARSIPKEFRQELKKEPTTPTCDVIKEVVSSETPTEEKVLPFPKAKSKIEFFEKLKN